MIDLANTPVAQALVDKQTYVFRLSALSCRKSKKVTKDVNGDPIPATLYLSGEAAVIEGDSLGATASLPFLGLRDGSGKKRTGQWIAATKLYLGKLVGDPDLITDLPSAESEVTPTMKMLMTDVAFEATVKHIPAVIDEETGLEKYQEKFELARILGPVDVDNIVEVDWDAQFSD